MFMQKKQTTNFCKKLNPMVTKYVTDIIIFEGCTALQCSRCNVLVNRAVVS